MTNNLTLAKEIWYELVGFIDHPDRQDAADSLMSILIDSDIAPADIRETFKGDEWISDSITNHLKDDIIPDIMEDDWEDEDYSDEIDEDY